MKPVEHPSDREFITHFQLNFAFLFNRTILFEVSAIIIYTTNQSKWLRHRWQLEQSDESVSRWFLTLSLRLSSPPKYCHWTEARDVNTCSMRCCSTISNFKKWSIIQYVNKINENVLLVTKETNYRLQIAIVYASFWCRIYVVMTQKLSRGRRL